jgi:beta-carotene 3-hydroxylase
MFWWGPVVLILVFLGMEFVAWATHKYVMHGFLWKLHIDHHSEHKGFFERNDFFFLIFAIPSALCIYLGMTSNNYFAVWIGYGIALYGFAYFMFHDVYIHRRFKWLRDIDHPYFMAIRKAHKIHHKKKNKEDGECFGMLLVPKKFFQEARFVFNRKKNKG